MTHHIAIWQALEPLLDEHIIQSLRDMDDPDAELDCHDIDVLGDYCDCLQALANLLAPLEAEPSPDCHPSDEAATNARQIIRQRILEERHQIIEIFSLPQ